jgi:hypothetical protein
MASMKAQILQAVEQHKKITWDDIVEVEPDAIDLEMIKEIENDSDCHIYISRDELLSHRKARR